MPFTTWCPGSSINWIISSTSRAGQSRSINWARAVAGSGAERISAMTSSMLATAIDSPAKTCARSRAWPSKYCVRRVTTSSRKSTNAPIIWARFINSGRPLFSAKLLTPKDVCSGENLYSWFKTTSAIASRFSSITTRTPVRSLSSRNSEMPSIRLARTASAIFSIMPALFT